MVDSADASRFSILSWADLVGDRDAILAEIVPLLGPSGIDDFVSRTVGRMGPREIAIYSEACSTLRQTPPGFPVLADKETRLEAREQFRLMACVSDQDTTAGERLRSSLAAALVVSDTVDFIDGDIQKFVVTALPLGGAIQWAAIRLLLWHHQQIQRRDDPLQHMLAVTALLTKLLSKNAEELIAAMNRHMEHSKSLISVFKPTESLARSFARSRFDAWVGIWRRIWGDSQELRTALLEIEKVLSPQLPK